MAGPTPIVRQFVLCERATFNADRTYTLHNPLVDVVIEPGQSFPLAHPELWLFAQLTGSYGRQEFRVQLVDVTDPSQPPAVVFRSPDRVIQLGPPPGPYRLRSRGWAMKFTRVPLPRPGRYEFWLLADGIPQAQAPFLVEEGS
jgi:hypothetical protein